ncbi:hypothetical protein BB559_004044 [Furculomyces boomerangus]|uniref:Sphingolipid delta4-desaturase N-terminal domain-containing protein n=1 Tax=Furculomyces boomerangus TaxID=61424 RepID=A0A2T9YH39_9FUNG|nr:hypothetical protein BB559_004044 [Furculomyces boomerangus]
MVSERNTTQTQANQPFDLRNPDYLGFWHVSVPNKNKQPTYDIYEEPHIKRKISILQKHPEIKNLYGYDTRTIYITIVTVSAQLFMAYLFGRVFKGSIITLVLAAYFIGATISALYGVIFHEISHNLAAKSTLVNRWVGLVANIPLMVPLSQSFRRYHLEHHTYLGVDGYDPDLPLQWEIKLVGNNPVLKFFFLFIYGVMYIGRGVAQNKTISVWEIYNIFWTMICDVLIIRFMGPRAVLYLLLSVLFGYGPHPGAAHFIQEHYTFVDGQETYSYYGSGNKFYMNIGYHNEHHDFLHIPWSKLPAVKQMAPEFYENLAYHDSWFRVLYLFVTCDLLAPQSRLVRTYQTHIYSKDHYKISPQAESKPNKKAKGTNLSAISDREYNNLYKKLKAA